MESVSFNEFKKSALSIPFQQEQSYLISYKEFLTYFKNLEASWIQHHFLPSGWITTFTFSLLIYAEFSKATD